MSESKSARQTVKDRKDGIEQFIKRLESLKKDKDRAALARLRRSLADYGRDFSAYVVLGHTLPAKASPWTLESYLLVAGLFAMHQQNTNDGKTLGWSLRQLRDDLGEFGEKSLDLLVGALLNAEREDLPIRLRHIITRLSASEKIGVDYGRLLYDLLRWDFSGRPVQRRWAHDYWVAGREPKNNGAPNSATTANDGENTLSGEE